tara:strand:+ start:618 stop:1085 length:468 start_codon:yes stop_codon:yes gene_type:complete
MSKAAVFVAILFIGLFAGAIAAPASTMGQDSIVITNETWVPNAAAATNLIQSHQTAVIYNPFPIVKTNGTGSDPKVAAVQNIDYKFNNNNGTVQAMAGGKLIGLTDASITYSYTAQNPIAATFTSIFGGLSKGMLGLMVVITFMLVMSALMVAAK